MSRSRWFLAAVLLALAGAGLLIMQWAAGRMFWLDEEMIAINVRDRSLGQLVGPLGFSQAAPYGWLAVQRALLLAFGTGERVLRFFPVACGVATLAVALWIGFRFMRPIGAAMLVFLCGIGQWIAFHALELKHYSADVLAALVLSALAAWALERPDEREPFSGRRVFGWWIIAAAGQWLANGALFAAPACAVVIVGIALHRGGFRAGVRAALPGVIWLASFALNYKVTLAPAMANDFLREFWAGALPPPGSGVPERLAWITSRFEPLAIKPGGSGSSVIFWSAAAIGLALAPGYTAAFRLSFAAVPLSAFVWGAVGLVPLAERLALWIVPAIYVGIAMSAELAMALLTRGWSSGSRWRWARGAAGALLAAALVVLAIDVFDRGTIYLNVGRYVANHGLDDRGAVTWLARQRRDGDVWVTTLNAIPAVLWYAAPSPDTTVLEASLRTEPDCGPSELAPWVGAHARQRLLIYLGFGHDVPKEFDDVLLARLGTAGRVVAYRSFALLSHAIVFEPGAAAASPMSLAALSGQGPNWVEPPREGCIAFEPAHRW